MSDDVDFTIVAEVFRETREVAKDDRLRILDERCGANAALRREVESLLAHHDETRTHADPLDDRISQVVRAEADSALLASGPRTLGRYEILDELGEGGMGVVYRARQASPEREVALKVIRAGLTTRRMLRRFELESAVLGRLHHPGIAQIFEAGTADTGSGPQPYLAMELVVGPTITKYAEDHELSAADRIELVALVCDAVHHAHQRGIIHRDLKPANVVVDSTGRPKILDFGVARVTDSDLQLTTFQTDVGQLIGTLPYMSPEQAAGDPEQIDVRSDVYALGVLMFELLSGRLPYDVAGVPVAEAARIIRDESPQRLSSIDRSLRGDLETIVLKALEKDKERRYESAADLGRDLRRHLGHEPIHARPASATYQLAKFARRNKALVAGACTAFVLLIVAVVGTSLGMAEAGRSADRESRVSDFLQEMFTRASPQLGGAEIRLLDVADLAAATVHERFADDARQESTVRSMLAEMYESQGMWAKALEQYTAAIELVDGVVDAEDPDVLAMRAGRFDCMSRLERRREIEEEAPQWVEPMVRVLGPADHATIVTRRETALTHAFHSDFEESERQLRILLADIRNHDAAYADELDTARYLARMLDAQARIIEDESRRNALFDEAITLLEELLDRVSADDPDAEIDRLNADVMLIEILGMRGRFEESAARGKAILERTEGRFVETHTVRLYASRHLATALFNLGEYAAAADSIVHSVDGLLDTLGPRNPVTIMGTIDALPILYVAGNADDGERYARLTHEVMASFSHDPAGSALYEVYVAAFLIQQERIDEAAKILERLLALAESGGFEEKDPLTFALLQLVAAELDVMQGRRESAARRLAAAQAAASEHAEAPPWLQTAIESARQRLDEAPAINQYASPMPPEPSTPDHPKTNNPAHLIASGVFKWAILDLNQ